MGLFFSSSSFNTAKSSQCFYDKLVGLCGSCENMKPKNFTSGLFSGYKYKCTSTGGYCAWNEKTCRRLVEIDPEKVDCVERYYNFTGRRYFVLTAIFEILNIDMDKPLYTKISSLIDSIREDASTEVEAIEYDIIGMDIANCLRKDENRVDLCNYLLENYIIKIYCLIGYNKINEAVTMYKDMVRSLYIRYRNIDNYNEIINSELLTKNKMKTI